MMDDGVFISQTKLLETMEKMWGLTPQPPKPEYADFIANSDPREWEAKHFGDMLHMDLCGELKTC